MVNYNVPFLKPGLHLILSGQVISQIYQGKITQWNDPAITALNPNAIIPPRTIVALHRSDSSGDTFIFSSFLSAADPSGWGSSIGYGTSVAFPAIPNAVGENGNGGLVIGMPRLAGCIAYIGISYLSQTQKAGLGEAELVNESGNPELPTAATILAESQELASSTPANETLSMIYDKAPGGYPIVNYEYAIIPPKEPDANTAAAVRAFLYWAIDPAKGSRQRFLARSTSNRCRRRSPTCQTTRSRRSPANSGHFCPTARPCLNRPERAAALPIQPVEGHQRAQTDDHHNTRPGAAPAVGPNPVSAGRGHGEHPS